MNHDYLGVLGMILTGGVTYAMFNGATQPYNIISGVGTVMVFVGIGYGAYQLTPIKTTAAAKRTERRERP